MKRIPEEQKVEEQKVKHCDCLPSSSVLYPVGHGEGSGWVRCDVQGLKTHSTHNKFEVGAVQFS